MEVFIIKTTFQYDSKGHEIEMNRYNLYGSLKYKKMSKYDSKGHETELIEINSYNYSNNGLKWKTTYQYDFDSYGNWIKKISHKTPYKEQDDVAEPTTSTAFVAERILEYY